MYSQNQNADLAAITILWLVNGSNALRDHQLSMRKNTSKTETTLVFCARTRHKTERPKSFRSVFLLLESSKMFILHYHIDTTTHQLSLTFIHVMDQRTVTLSFKFGVRTSWILVTISDATSVLEQLRLTLFLQHSFGADQPFQKL